ncbi:MAG: DUF2461 domain-containing protein [Cytophagales bacterium]|nr:DUF2461 domain-containing protein [Cytophagales bacterium]
MSLTPSLLAFLLDLKSNNSREWFGVNKASYTVLKVKFEEFVAQLILEFGEFENLDGVQVKNCTYRINRDVRFTKNKDPYKTWFSVSISEGGRKSGFMDYYLHIEPNGKSFLGGGMYNPSPDQIAKYRQEIDYNAKGLRKIIDYSLFKETYGPAQGESLKYTPKGFDALHPDADLLKVKTMFFWCHFTDDEVTSDQFVDLVIKKAKVLKPYLDFLNATFFDKEPFLKV